MRLSSHHTCYPVDDLNHRSCLCWLEIVNRCQHLFPLAAYVCSPEVDVRTRKSAVVNMVSAVGLVCPDWLVGDRLLKSLALDTWRFPTRVPHMTHKYRTRISQRTHQYHQQISHTVHVDHSQVFHTAYIEITHAYLTHEDHPHQTHGARRHVSHKTHKDRQHVSTYKTHRDDSPHVSYKIHRDRQHESHIRHTEIANMCYKQDTRRSPHTCHKYNTRRSQTGIARKTHRSPTRVTQDIEIAHMCHTRLTEITNTNFTQDTQGSPTRVT